MPGIEANRPSRRQVLAAGAVGAGLVASGVSSVAAADVAAATEIAAKEKKPLFEISLAQWSLHRTLKRDDPRDNLRFPEISKRELGIDAVEYVNQFFKRKAQDQAYLTELKQRCDDLEVKSLLIMCDGEGALGDADQKKRDQAVDNHRKWLDAAKFLGCHSIRVNAQSQGSREEQTKLATDGLRKLSKIAAASKLNVLVENHGGLSSDGGWLAGVIKGVDLPNCGTLPDFGNFRIGEGKQYDRYQGVTELMPQAKAVSAKSRKFNDQGEETNTDYLKMMKIVLKAGYHGYVGIEWEGGKPGEMEGIKLTKQLLERVRSQLSS